MNMTQSLKCSMKLMEDKAAERERVTVSKITELSNDIKSVKIIQQSTCDKTITAIKSAATPPAQTYQVNVAEYKMLQEEVHSLKQELRAHKEKSEKRECELSTRVSALAAELQAVRNKQPLSSIPVPPVPPVAPLMNNRALDRQSDSIIRQPQNENPHLSHPPPFQNQQRQPPQQYAQQVRSAPNHRRDDQQITRERHPLGLGVEL